MVLTALMEHRLQRPGGCQIFEGYKPPVWLNNEALVFQKRINENGQQGMPIPPRKGYDPRMEKR